MTAPATRRRSTLSNGRSRAIDFPSSVTVANNTNITNNVFGSIRKLYNHGMSLFSPTLSTHASNLPAFPPRDPTIHQNTSQNITSALDTISRSRDEEFPDKRPSKRRKLEIRDARQQTLDNFFSSNPLRPPVKIAQLQPHGSLVETVNGVQNKLVTLNGHDSAVSVPQLDGPAEAPYRESRRGKAPEHKKAEEKRTLRSQDDGPRLKSELATYFNNYEDIIFDTLQEPELLNIGSTLYITDDTAAKGVTPSPAKSFKSSRDGSSAGKQPTAAPTPKATEIDLSVIMRSVPEDAQDPMSDEAFLVSHRRAERKEKQMRNIEREHAMHEKVQLDRILDGLLGHDWLRVLGITGITDGEAKKYEPKRDYFVAEVKTLVSKFDAWKEAEKRQRLSRESLLAAQREAEEEDDDTTTASSHGAPSSDLNRSASRQLQQEAAAARAKKRKEQQQVPVVPYRPPSPIKSFYPSKHVRESALKKSRNSRNQTAFGLPIPEMEEHEFALPGDYLTADVLRASARDRRRRQREQISSSASK